MVLFFSCSVRHFQTGYVRFGRITFIADIVACAVDFARFYYQEKSNDHY